MQLNEILTEAGQTSEVEADGKLMLLAVIAEDTASLVAQLQIRIGADWVNIGTALTAIGTISIVVPGGFFRVNFTGTTIVDIQIGLAT